MKLNADAVQLAYAWLGLPRKTRGQAAEAAKLYGGRDEFLAHLILKEEILSSGAQTRELVATARAAYVPTATPRRQYADLQEIEKRDVALEMAMKQAIESDLLRVSTFSAAYHARIDRELLSDTPDLETWPARES